ncbi:MAG: hypothetical protein J6B72_06805 [Clostridia bacterium]|nr:hypothetical protein [Clostridia bacterium]
MKNVWKMIIAFVLVACMALAVIACDYDEIVCNGDSNNSGENVGDSNGTVDNEDNAGESGSQDNEADSGSNGLDAPGANTEGGWSQLYPAG